MKENKHSVKPQDLQLNQHYWIADEDGKMQEMILLEMPRYKNYIIEMPSLGIRDNKEQLVMYNINFPRDIYVDILNTNYRPIF